MRLFLLLSVLIGFLCTTSCKQETRTPIPTKSISENVKTNLQINLFNQFLSDFSTLDSTITVQGTDLQKTTLKSLFKRPTLVFRYSL